MSQEKFTFKDLSSFIAQQLKDAQQLSQLDTYIRNYKFVLFIFGLIILYIYNAQNVERLIIQSDKLRNQIKEMRFEFLTTKSELMFKSNQSEIAKKLEIYGIKESTVPPNKIVVEDGSEY
jgi:hypothetical protein